MHSCIWQPEIYYNIGMKRHDNRHTYGRTCAYNLNYHIVWEIKYRNKVLNGKKEKAYAED